MESTVKVSRYVPIFGMLQYEYHNKLKGITIEGICYPMEILFDGVHDELELNEIHLQLLDEQDRFAFKHWLRQHNDNVQVIDTLRDSLEDFVECGGGTHIEWINLVLYDIGLNYSSYPTVHREEIQTMLLRWHSFYTLMHQEDVNIENEDKLKINQIALIHNYNREPISRFNCDAIAQKYGHTSGEKLRQQYSYYSSRSNRINPDDGSSAKTKNKINLIESIIPLLEKEPAIREATDELNTLKSKEHKYI
jgi:hypothetical protein